MFVINGRFLSQKVTGVQRFAIELTKRLKEVEKNIIVLAPKNIIQQELAIELGVKIIGRNVGHLWEQLDLPFYLRKNGNPLLVNFCNTAPLLYPNSIVTIHDLAFLENPGWFSRKFYLGYRFLIPLIARKSKRIFTVSEFSKSEIYKKLKVDKPVDVIYNGVEHITTLNKSEEVYPNQPYILFVGSLDPRKNMGKLIEAMKFIRQGVVLKIVGGNNGLFSQLYSDIKLSDRVHFLGYVSDAELSTLYQSAVCFVYPSLYEGFGIPPLEAQVSGTPVVASNIRVFNEVLGDSALYFDPQNSKDIASTICKLLALNISERNQLIEKGYNNIKRFNWQNSANRVIEKVKLSK
ncbi:glycosyltransferase involved in cell wall biosynthesis [Marinilabilia salmonicolor]|nr:glycosyltransferase involved in cell wall biosynthesis [Marinilabilia salmonicolor]